MAKLPEMWLELVLKSKNVDASLIVVKRKFTEITMQQIKDFGKELQEFEERFRENGPGSIGRDLDKGNLVFHITVSSYLLICGWLVFDYHEVLQNFSHLEMCLYHSFVVRTS